jgi:hypothetical protein
MKGLRMFRDGIIDGSIIRPSVREGDVIDVFVLVWIVKRRGLLAAKQLIKSPG